MVNSCCGRIVIKNKENGASEKFKDQGRAGQRPPRERIVRREVQQGQTDPVRCPNPGPKPNGCILYISFPLGGDFGGSFLGTLFSGIGSGEIDFEASTMVGALELYLAPRTMEEDTENLEIIDESNSVIFKLMDPSGNPANRRSREREDSRILEGQEHHENVRLVGNGERTTDC